MIPITNQAQLTQVINEVLQNILREIAKETVEYLKVYVDTIWYNNHWHGEYQRTYQLLESIVNSEIESKGKGFEIVVFFDTSKITPNFMGGDTWNQHMGVNGRPFTEGLVEVIEEGHKTPSLWDIDGIGMFKYTSDWLEKKLPQIAKKVFNKNGINVTIT